MANEISILITDDIEDNRLILKNICKKLKDVRVLEAVNGLEATQIVENEDIDIVLMDVMMPVMDGFEATKIIKEMDTPPYLLIITAVSDKETEDKFIKLGIDGYVRKPVDKEAIKSKLEGLISSCLVKKGAKTGMSAKKPISKQAGKCRNFKTYFYISDEEDAMSLGLWLTDLKSKNDAGITFEFEDDLAAVYKLCKSCIKVNSPLTVIVEEDFENAYLTFIPSNSIDCMEINDMLSASVKKNLLCETTLIYLTIKMGNESKMNFAEPLKPNAEPKEKITVSEEDVELLRRSHTDKISARQFVADFAETGSMDEIYDLKDIEEKWKELNSDLSSSNTKEALISLIDGAIDEYSRVINRIYEFSAIGYALSSLCAFLRSIEEERVPTVSQKLSMLLGLVLDDLVSWRNNIFVIQETADIHYLDSSLLSSCMQIDALISEKVAAADDDDDDLELF